VIGTYGVPGEGGYQQVSALDRETAAGEIEVVTYCTRLFAHEYPSTEACVVLVVNKNMKMADKSVNAASENLRPPTVNLPLPRVRSTT